MSYAHLVQADGATHYWPLSETSGTSAQDLGSGTKVNGTYTGTYTLGSTALLPGTGQASVLLGGAGYVNLGDDASFSPQAGASGAMTLECIFKAGSTNSTQMLMSKSASGASEYQFYQANATQLVIQWQQGNFVDIGGVTSTAFLTVGQTYHLACTFDRAASIAEIFVNGVLNASSNVFSGNSADTGTAFNLGARVGSLNAIGNLGHGAIYPTRLSAAAILSHYRESLRGGVTIGQGGYG